VRSGARVARALGALQRGGIPQRPSSLNSLSREHAVLHDLADELRVLRWAGRWRFGRGRRPELLATPPGDAASSACRTVKGATVLTRMPYCASRAGRQRIKPRRRLGRRVGDRPTCPSNAAIDAVLSNARSSFSSGRWRSSAPTERRDVDGDRLSDDRLKGSSVGGGPLDPATFLRHPVPARDRDAQPSEDGGECSPRPALVLPRTHSARNSRPSPR